MLSLIVLRGNSGSGKTTTAKNLKNKLGHNSLYVSTDQIYVHMVSSLDKEVKTKVSLELFNSLIEFGFSKNFVIIIDGNMSADIYEECLLYWKDKIPNNHFYYFDIPLEETFARHDTRINRIWFSKDKMKEWYAKDNKLRVINEKVINEDMSEEQTLDMILSDLEGLAGIT